MALNKVDTISQLQKEILLLQGFKSFSSNNAAQIKLGLIDNNLPNGCLPLAAVHEFISDGSESIAATNGFICCLLSSLVKNNGACVWINSLQTVFPPAFLAFDIDPDRFIFINVQKEKEILWTIEEALKCGGLAAVVGETPEISFTASRRFQLAVEESLVTGFIIRNHPRNANINACVSRWKISPLESDPKLNLPGIGFPRWNIDLLKIRNGKPGTWQMEWALGKLHPISPLVAAESGEERRKAG